MTTEVLGIDVGGSSVKGGLVDVARGAVRGTLISAPTPRPCTPASLMPVPKVSMMTVPVQSRPLPKRISAMPAASASFSISTGRPSACAASDSPLAPIQL